MKSGDKYIFERRDEKGNKLTIKEAFRLQCGIFHGIRKSKKKREKMMMKTIAERKAGLMDQSKDSKAMQALQHLQKDKKIPYMVLDAKKPIIL